MFTAKPCYSSKTAHKTLGQRTEQIFAARCQFYVPTEEEFRRELERTWVEAMLELAQLLEHDGHDGR